MTQIVLSVPNSDINFFTTLADKMGWHFQTKESLISRFIESCPKDAALTDEEIQAEVNAVRYGEK